jgi:large subunit ribosomal protein L24
MKLKTGDKVIVIAGSNKGKTGKITKVINKENRVIVEGVNVVKKHKKPSSQDQTGGIIEREAPIHASNVKLVDKKDTKVVSKIDKKPKVSKKSSKKND